MSLIIGHLYFASVSSKGSQVVLLVLGLVMKQPVEILHLEHEMQKTNLLLYHETGIDVSWARVVTGFDLSNSLFNESG